MTTQIKSLQQILADKFPQLGNITQKIQNLRHLNKIFHATLDTDIAKHCQIATFDQKKMVLIVDNSSWATRLRYTIPDMIKILNVQPEFKKLKKIRYRIKSNSSVGANDYSPLHEPPASNHHKTTESKQQAKNLHNLAKKSTQ